MSCSVSPSNSKPCRRPVPRGEKPLRPGAGAGQRERGRRPLIWALALAGVQLAIHPSCTVGPNGAGASPVGLAGTAPLVARDLVFEERGGFVAVEAEHFSAQSRTERRGWQLVTATQTPAVTPDGDPPHVAGASGGAYLELLPDTRRTHYEPIIVRESFSNLGGEMAVLSYRVRFTTPGRYYVWVRAYSTGGEDNGLHAGLDGTWPESGLRWQTTHKHAWAWDSRQRTDAVPRGEPHKLYLDVPAAGEHTVHFSMREDGFEFDRWIMTTDRAFVPSADGGPPTRVAAGRAPAPFPVPAGYRDPAPAELEHDGSGLAMPEGDFRPGGTVTLVLNGPAADAGQSMVAEFAHESGARTIQAAGRFAGGGKWRASFVPDRVGQWYFTIRFRDAAGSPVKTFDNLSGIFPVTARAQP